MSQLTSEQKLRLVHSIREENKQNQMAMRSRENILFGTNMPLVDMENEYEAAYKYGSGGEDTPAAAVSPFGKIRLFAAIALLAGFIFMDMSKIKVMGMDAAYIENKIEQDYMTNLFDFINTFPYTLKGEAVTPE